MNNKKVKFLTPINVEIPPYNTKIHWPRCFTCNKFEVCNLRGDYLKTCLLIENILGNPQEDLLLQQSNGDINCGCYKGNPIENAQDLFPPSLTISKRVLPDGTILSDMVEANFIDAIYQDLNTVLFRYNSQGYIIIFKALYDENLKEFTIMDGIEIVYGIKYEFPADNILEVQINLDTWQTTMKQKEEENKKLDIINTTYFSAQLNCDFYEAIKGLSPEEGMKRIIAKFPDGVPCGENQYYHLETLHIEPNKIPWWNPNAGKVAFAPLPYPIFLATKCPPKKPVRRDDLDGDF